MQNHTDKPNCSALDLSSTGLAFKKFWQSWFGDNQYEH